MLRKNPGQKLAIRKSAFAGSPDVCPPMYQNLEPRQLLAQFVGPLATGVDIGQFSAAYVAQDIPDAFVRDAVTLESMMARSRVTAYMPGEVVVAVELPVAKDSAVEHLGGVRWIEMTGVEGTSVIRHLMIVSRGNHQSTALVHLRLGSGGNVLESMQTLDRQPVVLWSAPNFVQGASGDPRDFIPNDPSYGSQYHHPLMQNNLAWDLSLGNPAIRVGVTDDGVALTHPDLAPNIFVNPGEIAGNGVDDDGNGYIDDVNGWDFSSNNNDPNPNGTSNDHGTHVAGIAAGRTNNGIGIAGVAGLATIVPLQFYAGTGAWTAAVINATYTYAADMGVQIVTTSYNVDGWVGDPVFTAGLQYMYDAGVLHFNSAGNNNSLNPPRQVFDQSLFVASTDSSDVRSSFSNYGTGIDVSAPGSSIFSTVTNNGYGTKSGTSMATPNAAGAAALLWGANPSWNRDQVAARLLGTADNIDSMNPSYVGWLGSGRVNPFAAMTTALAAPKIKSFSGLPAEGSVTGNFGISSFTVAFDQVMDPASVNNLSNYVLREAGLDGIFGNSDDQQIAVTADKPYMIGTNIMSFSLPGGGLEPGYYRLTLVAGGLQNPFGTDLDGNGNGTGGDSFTRTFRLEPTTLQLATQGSLVYEQRYSASISASGQKDDYYINLDAGQRLTVVSRATGALVPTVQVRNPSGATLANVSGSGGAAVANSVAVSAGGRYRLTFGGVGSSTGSYDVQILLNSDAELEGLGGATNNTLATAQNLDGSGVVLGGDADRLGVVGQLPSGSGTALYLDGFESGGLGSQWTTSSSTSSGRIRVTGSAGTAAGSFAMIMDTSASGTYNRNQADWTVNLAGLTAATLRFSHADFSDEDDALPSTFVNSANGDGVAISSNGVNWYTVYTPTSSSSQWLTQNIDLVAAASAAGFSLNSTFRIRFQQYDNFPVSTDGRGYDEISILVPAPSEDWYAFSLADGESATIAGSRTGTVGSINVALYNGSGVLLQSGVAATNISSYISRYQDSTTNGTRDSYFLRVSGLDANYSLIVNRNAEFDREANDVANATAQDIGGLRGALGFATPNPDFYRFSASVGETVRFEASLPAGGPDLFVNGLVAGSSSNLRLQLVAPGGAVVASGITDLEHTVASAGTYFLRVSALSGSGEYFAQRVPTSVSVESGTIQLVGLEGVSVSFSQPFVDPVVIVSPPGTNHALPILASVSNVTTSGFDVRLHLWNTDFETPVFETLSYVVFERGETVLPNGSRILAGESLVADSEFSPVTFSTAFAATPVVMTTADLDVTNYARSTRLNSVTTSGFMMGSQFAEFSAANSDDQTRAFWVAMEPGRYTFGDITIEAGLTPTPVTHLANSFSFLQPFAGVPSLVAAIQTFNDGDPAALRMPAVTASGATLFIGEEQTLDPEVVHGAESVGYLAIYQGGLLSPLAEGGEGLAAGRPGRGSGSGWLLPAPLPGLGNGFLQDGETGAKGNRENGRRGETVRDPRVSRGGVISPVEFGKTGVSGYSQKGRDGSAAGGIRIQPGMAWEIPGDAALDAAFEKLVVENS